MIKANPCLSCGACCAFFRASFYWGETDAVAGGTVPQELTQQLTPFRAVMCGTDQPNPRCIALTGEIGVQVSCKIHPLRSSVCRDFIASWENGEHNLDCDRARARHGLPPLMPDSSNKPEPLPHNAYQ